MYVEGPENVLKLAARKRVMSPVEQASEQAATPDEPPETSGFVDAFDRLCFSIGDQDAILLFSNDNSGNSTSSSICYFEIQEYSKALAAQIQWRFGRPDYVLVDGQQWPGAEAVATLACMRLKVPFVPIVTNTTATQTSSARPPLASIVDCLRKSTRRGNPVRIVAITVAHDDRDAHLIHFAHPEVAVHHILYIDQNGSLREQLSVPQGIPVPTREDDDLYVLFTSGTLSSEPKAVIGSVISTWNRLEWGWKQARLFGRPRRVARRTKLTFVDGVTELWETLLDQSATLVAVEPSLHTHGVAALIQETQCTQILLLPSQLGQLLILAEKDETSFCCLQRVLVSGEVFPASLYRQFRKNFSLVELINLYGQTESTGDCCAAVLSDMEDTVAVKDDVVTIGEPIAGNLLAQGKNGELSVEGNLGNGYLCCGSSVSPFHRQSRFATGDVGFCENGKWYVQGRKDDVLKISGIWTSPQDVQSALETYYSNHYRQESPLGSQKASAEWAVVPVGGAFYAACTDGGFVQSFSRANMHTESFAWNLIPKVLYFCQGIPRSQSGAGKVDRTRLIHVARHYHESSHLPKQSAVAIKSINLANEACTLSTRFLKLVCSVLQLDIAWHSVDLSKSFVDLGGDSASAVSLLYNMISDEILRDQCSHKGDRKLTPLDILEAENLQQLMPWNKDLSRDGDSTKRRRLTGTADIAQKTSSPTPRPRAIAIDSHWTIPMLACVDAPPLYLDGHVFAASQGGMVVCAVFTADGPKTQNFQPTVLAHQTFPGYRIQSALVAMEHGVLVCCTPLTSSEQSTIFLLSKNLGSILWQHQLPKQAGRTDQPGIKCSPVRVGDAVCILFDETELILVSSTAGDKVDFTAHSPVSLPHLCVGGGCFVDIQNGPEKDGFLVLGVSDYEGGLMIFSLADSTIHVEYQDTVGPVNKPILFDRNLSLLLVADSWGSLHCFDFKCYEASRENSNLPPPLSISMSSFPLSEPSFLNGSVECESSIFVGGYDGILRCVRQGKVAWTVHCGASIYSKPLVVEDGSYVMCATTAGDLRCVDFWGDTLWTMGCTTAEIWSNPVMVNVHGDNEIAVTFGARDSNLHIVRPEIRTRHGTKLPNKEMK